MRKRVKELIAIKKLTLLKTLTKTRQKDSNCSLICKT